MLAVDVSGSMTEERLGGSALDRTRTAVDDLLRRTAGTRVGVVTFAGSAVTRLPPTTDTSLVRGVLETADVGVDTNGSAVGTALGLAVERLRATEARARVVVLVSDGRHNAGAISPETAAELARSAGVPVHALIPFAPAADGSVERVRSFTESTGGRTVVATEDASSLAEALAEVVPDEISPGPPIRTAAAGAWLWPTLLALALGLGLRATRVGGVG